MNFGFYPVNFKVHKRLMVGAGLDMGILLWDKTSFEEDQWSISGQLDDQVNEADLHYPLYLGLSARIQYPIEVSEGWFLAPTYRFRWGVSREFKGLHQNVGTKRHYFQVTLSHSFNFKKGDG